VQQQMIRRLASARHGAVRVLAVGFMSCWCAAFEWEELAILASKGLVFSVSVPGTLGQQGACPVPFRLPWRCVLEQRSARALICCWAALDEV
jgi:hypothetical protein